MLRLLLPGPATPASVCSCSFFRTVQLISDRDFYHDVRVQLATHVRAHGEEEEEAADESARGGAQSHDSRNSAGMRLCGAIECEFIYSHIMS